MFQYTLIHLKNIPIPEKNEYIRISNIAHLKLWQLLPKKQQ